MKNKIIEKSRAKKYKLTMYFNGLVFTKQTDDIAKSILDLTPEILYTEVYISVRDNKTKEVIDRRLNLTQGRKLFRDETILEIFINNLLLN